MSKPEQSVRAAAAALYSAIVTARAAGLFVQWPNRADDLPGIAISETKKATAAAPVVEPVASAEPQPPADPERDDEPTANAEPSFAGRGRRSKG